MPYLDLSDTEDFAHFCQLFLAAHPGYRELHEVERPRMRKRTVPWHEYFLDLEMAHAMANWGRQRHLITRKAAARFVEQAFLFFGSPADVVSLTMRQSGTHPRQLTVLSTEIYAFLTGNPIPPQPRETVAVLPIPTAIKWVQSFADEHPENRQLRARVRQLIVWLREQTEE
jgi:hypothetical protein